MSVNQLLGGNTHRDTDTHWTQIESNTLDIAIKGAQFLPRVAHQTMRYE